MNLQFAKSLRQKAVTYGNARTVFRLAIPNLITLLRLLVLPHLVWSFNHENMFAIYVLFLFSIGSDLADGYIARKIRAKSKFGANIDPTVDFIFINGMYLTFVLKGIYEAWIMVLIIFMFLQFLLTNHAFRKVIYDPIGKYYGSLLFGGIGLTLLSPTQIMSNIVTAGIIISTIATMFSRLLYFYKN